MKRTLRFISFVALWLVAFAPVLAQQVCVDDAMQSAKQFLSRSTSARARAKSKATLSLAYKSEQGGKTHFYVFNSGAQDGGFVIVGGDEAASEILGYCESGAFDYESAPANVKWWLSQYDSQIAEGIRQGINSRKEVKTNTMKKAAAKQNIPYLVKTKWNQYSPYSNWIPFYDSSKRFVTGCVATAVAQIMKYYNYPASGVGSKSYNIDYPEGTVTFSADFENTTYDWDNMLNEYNYPNYSQAEADAVAILMYHVGVSADMNYGLASDGGSGASSETASESLVKYFKYDKSLQCMNRSLYSDDEWEDIVYNELAEGRPILYSGTSAEGGHAFVCDGYSSSSSLYHINWGWGGFCDGDFALTGTGALAPHGSGAGGAGDEAAYTANQHITIGIKPDEGGDYVYKLGWGIRTAPSLSSASVPQGSQVTIHGSINNLSAATISCSVALRFTNGSTNIDKSIGSISDLEAGWSFGDYSRTFKTSDLPEGTYTVKLIYKVGDGDWQLAQLPYGTDYPTLTITKREEPYFNLGWGMVSTAQSVSPTSVSRGSSFMVNGSIINLSEESITCDLGVRLTNGSTTIDKSLDNISKLGSGYSYGNYQISVPTNDVPEGEYTVKLIFKVAGEDWTVAKIKGGTDYPMVTITECTDPYLITTTPTFGNGEYVTKDISKMFLTFNVKNNTNADITETFTFYTIPDGGGSTQTLLQKNVTLPADKEIEVRIPAIYSFNELVEGKKYYARRYINGWTGSPYYFNVVAEKPISYTMTSAGWGTLILPFDAEVPDGWTVWTCSSMDGPTLNLTEDTKIRQFTPYIVSGETGTYNFNGPDVPGNLMYKNGMLTGIMNANEYQLQEDDYILQKQGNIVGFFKVGTGPKNGAYAAAYRCILNPIGIDANNDSAMFPSGNEITGIEGEEIITPTDATPVEIFSISGAKQGNLQQGINIVRLSDGRTVKVVKK